MTDHIHDEKSPCIFDELRDHPTLLKSVIGDGELTPCRYGAQDEEQGRFNSNRPSSELFTIRDNGIPVCREHHALLKNACYRKTCKNIYNFEPGNAIFISQARCLLGLSEFSF